MRRLPLRLRTSSSRLSLLRPASLGSSRASLTPGQCLSHGDSSNVCYSTLRAARLIHSSSHMSTPVTVELPSASGSTAVPTIFDATAAATTTTTTPTHTASDLDYHGIPARRRCDSHKASSLHTQPKLPFHFETGVGLFAKRTPRPFPPPFLSPPSGSFSDALSTHDRSRDRRELVDGQLIGGCTNGDDAVFAGEYFVAANDGVGAWSMRPRGHAGLWSRLVVHFWANAVSESVAAGSITAPEPVKYLQRAYEQTIEATRAPNDWQGTTTAAGALLSYRQIKAADDRAVQTDEKEPVLYVTNLGDSQIMVVRPAEGKIIFKTTEQWHWFDCPRQLGTNSPDTPRDNAVVDVVPINVGDIVLAMSDGLIDNLWAHEIVDRVSKSVAAWQAKDKTPADLHRGMMTTVAEDLVEAARVIAVDPFAESPFMEHAIEEGLASEGGKLDDISVVAAVCRRSETA